MIVWVGENLQAEADRCSTSTVREDMMGCFCCCCCVCTVVDLVDWRLGLGCVGYWRLRLFDVALQ